MPPNFLLFFRNLYPIFGRNYIDQTIKAFINEETRKKLADFYKYIERNEPDELRKFSVNNYAVYEKVMTDEAKRVFPNYNNHIIL